MDNYSMPQPTPGEEYVSIRLPYGKTADFWPQVSEFMLERSDRELLEEQLRAYAGHVGFSKTDIITVEVKIDSPNDDSQFPDTADDYHEDFLS
jgi:hypothetical protein